MTKGKGTILQQLQKADGGSFGLSSFEFDKLLGDYIDSKFLGALPQVRFLYESLVKGGFSQDKPFTYNDLDNDAFYIPNEEFNVFCITSQNYNLVFILEEDGDDRLFDTTFHVRRYWDTTENPEAVVAPKYCEKSDVDWISSGKEHMTVGDAVTAARWIIEDYSDHVPGNDYVRRPDLEWYIQKGFDLKYKKDAPSRLHSYGDLRDPGYVYSVKVLTGEYTEQIGQELHTEHGFIVSQNSRDNADSLPLQRNALFQIGCLVSEFDSSFVMPEYS